MPIRFERFKGEDGRSRIAGCVVVNLSVDEVSELIGSVTHPGLTSSGPSYYGNFFEAWTSRDLHRVRRLRWRKFLMPFVQLSLEPVEGGDTAVIVQAEVGLRRWLGAMATACGLALLVAYVALDWSRSLLPLLAAWLYVAGMTVIWSPEMEVTGVIRVLRALLRRELLENPKKVRSLVESRVMMR